MISILFFLCGICVFVISMNIMIQAIKELVTNSFFNNIGQMLKIKYFAILIGILVTALMQSSSMVTIVLLGFVTSGAITPIQAFWVLLGANVGTTVTNQLLTINLSICLPFFFLLGLILLFFGNKKGQVVARVIISIGVLFVSMDIMQYATLPLATNKQVLNLFVTLENPVVGLLFGTMSSAILQSSSASVGILQSISMSGAFTLKQLAWVVYGQNIGTCITGMYVSVQVNTQAKQVILLQFLINVIGLLFFVCFCKLVDVVAIVEYISLDNFSSKVANLHTLYNVVVTVLLLPFDNWFIHIAEKIIKK